MVYNGRRKDVVLADVHLGVGVGGEEGDYLVGGYSHRDGTADGFAGYFSGNHVWVTGGELGEELEDGDLEM